MKNRILPIQWRGKRNIPIVVFALYYLFLMYHYSGENTFYGSVEVPVIIITILWLTVSLLSMFEIPTIRNFVNKYIKIEETKRTKVLLLMISPVISFVMAEIMVDNFYSDVFLKYGFFNLIWYYGIYLLIYALVRNIKITVIFGNLLIYLLAVVNYLVYLLRGNPVIPSDLLAWKTGMHVASHYKPYFTAEFMLASLIMLVLFVMAYNLKDPFVKHSVKNCLVGVGLYGLYVSFVFCAFFQTGWIQSVLPTLDLYAPKYTYITYGTAFGFMANVNAMMTKCPEGYSAGQVKEAFNQMEGEVKVKAAGNMDAAKQKSKPDIIAIMSESYSDLSLIGDYKTNMDYLPFARSLSKNTIKGKLFVSVFGGGTSDTEYEFLTGNSMAVMPANCVPYQQFVTKKTDSLASLLKEQGYYNIAIHPYFGSGYKRDIVYPLLGFDQFLDKDAFKNPQLIRSYISDRESFKKIIEQYKEKSGKRPLFIFNVTMQNHGGYTQEQLFDDKDTVRFTGGQGDKTVEQYLSLLRQSDSALKLLIDYFSKQKKPVLLLLFGDHQSSAFLGIHEELENTGKAAGVEGYLKKYQVPFLIWANYDIGEKKSEQMSANYLSSYLLKVAGLRGSEYNDYLMNLYQTLPVITGQLYTDRAGKSYLLNELNEHSKYYDAIKEYRYIGYNNALDRRNRQNRLYKLE